MKIELDDATATTLFVALRAYIRQLAIENLSAPDDKSVELSQLWKTARAAEVTFVAAMLEAKEEEQAK